MGGEIDRQQGQRQANAQPEKPLQDTPLLHGRGFETKAEKLDDPGESHDQCAVFLAEHGEDSESDEAEQAFCQSGFAAKHGSPCLRIREQACQREKCGQLIHALDDIGDTAHVQRMQQPYGSSNPCQHARVGYPFAATLGSPPFGKMNAQRIDKQPVAQVNAEIHGLEGPRIHAEGGDIQAKGQHAERSTKQTGCGGKEDGNPVLRGCAYRAQRGIVDQIVVVIEEEAAAEARPVGEYA
ncbi:MAG: hypothetical protein IPF61_02765 [Xanthomonadales bacterium]|nr:hypothetical protein [Xanthomonadales bacterium]